jgi:hypothetical protein
MIEVKLLGPNCRVLKSHIPNTPCRCTLTECVYNDAGECDAPRTNKCNSDAACHKAMNKNLLLILTKIEEE